jgi:hypothetical protein
MNNAFEITPIDIQTVFKAHGKELDDNTASDILLDIDADTVEDAALKANEMEQQTKYALEEIERQLFEQGTLTGDPKFLTSNVLKFM